MLGAIHIDIADIAAAQRFLASLPGTVDRGIEEGVLEAGMLLQRDVVERTPRAAGTLRDSIIAAAPERQGDAILGVVGSPLAYAVPVELGTKPHMPPLQPIIDWVRLKLGLKGKRAEKAAKAIRWKIFRRGTKGANMFKGAFEANQEQVGKLIAAAVGRAIEAHRQGGSA